MRSATASITFSFLDAGEGGEQTDIPTWYVQAAETLTGRENILCMHVVWCAGLSSEGDGQMGQTGLASLTCADLGNDPGDACSASMCVWHAPACDDALLA